MVGEFTPRSDIKALYHLEDVNDSSGNGKTLTNTGSVTFPVGKFRVCADFGDPNSTKRLSRADNLGINGSGSLSGSCWLKRRSYASGQDYVWAHYSTGGSDHYIALMYTSNTIQIDTGGTPRSALFTWDNEWHHFVVTRNGTTDVSLYADGTRVVHKAATGAGGAAQNAISIGATNIPDQWTSIYLDELVIFNRELTYKEIRDYYAWSKGLRAFAI